MERKSTLLEQYIALCKRIFERMERDGTWPWREEDSTDPEDVIEFDDNPEIV